MLNWLIEKIYKGFIKDREDTLEYGWVFGITFFLVLFLSQTLSIWIFGEVGSLLAWIILLVWSLGVTYFLLFGSGTYIFNKLRTFVDNIVTKKYLTKSRTDISRIPEVRKMESKPREEEPKEAANDAVTILEQKAHDAGALISRDALLFIAGFGGASDHVLEKVISTAKKEHPRFDGWVVLNKEQVTSLLENREGNGEFSTSTKSEEETYLGDVDRKNNTLTPANLPTGKLQSKNAGAAASFMQLLCEGNEQGLFTFIRKMRQGTEEDIREFIKDAILMLDRVHEHRVDGAGYVDQKVLEHARCFSNEELEEIIAILIGSVDYRYSVPEIGIKLSLIRALEYIKKARKS